MRLEPDLKLKIVDILGSREFYHCYQCGRCTSFCPVFNHFPHAFNPRKIIQKMFIGFTPVLQDPSLWLCTTCYECFEHCPFGINLADVIVAMRNLAGKRYGTRKELTAEWNQMLSSGYIYPETERLRKIRSELSLHPLAPDGAEDLKHLVSALQESFPKASASPMASAPSGAENTECHPHG